MAIIPQDNRTRRTSAGPALAVIVALAGAFVVAGPGRALANEAQASTQPSEAERWLTRIEKRAKKLDTLKVRLRYDRIKGLLGSKVRRFGTLKYKAGTPVQFSVHFDRLVEGNRARPLDRTYTFDGRWLAEKRSNEKVFIRRELVPKGQKRGLFEMEHQPFVLPLDQDKEYVLERFNVQLMQARENDEGKNKGKANAKEGDKNLIHLRLTPKEGKSIDLKRVDLWYDRESLLPKRAVTRQAGADEAADRSVVEVLSVKAVELKKGAFDTSPPTGDNWQVQIKRLKRDPSAEADDETSK
jgi:hypothetical protein